MRSNRISAVSVECHTHKWLIINGYLPVDNWSRSHVSEDFLNQCDIIECVINQHKDHKIIMAGDLNVDFNRENAHDCYMKCLLDRHDYTVCWDLPIAENDYTYSNEWTNSFSQIDHFCFSQDLLDCVEKVCVYESEINPPGHRPIISVIKSHPGLVEKAELNNNDKRIQWQKVTNYDITVYKDKMDSLLRQQGLYHVSLCKNLQCNDVTHRNEIDQWCDDLVNICKLRSWTMSSL